MDWVEDKLDHILVTKTWLELFGNVMACLVEALKRIICFYGCVWL